MNKFSALRRFAPVAIAVALFMLASCASSNKKYGCPNHLSSPVSVR